MSLLWTAAAVAACEHGGSAGSGPLAAANPAPFPGSAAAARFEPGHIIAHVTFDGLEYEWSGLLAPDGELRVNAEGPPPIGSLQLVGALAIDGSRASGSGTVIAQRCTLPTASRFCTETAIWQATLNMISTRVDLGADGEIVVTTNLGQERWPVRTGYWGGQARFGLASDLAYSQGLYKEVLAEFAAGHDVIIDFDANGRFFFQSWQTGCTGNGALVPHGASNVNLYSVRLTIGACTGALGYLNRTFEGLSVIEAQTPWDYDGFGPRMWLSTPQDEPQPAALTLWAPPIA